jgi:hypothetical protein
MEDELPPTLFATEQPLSRLQKKAIRDKDRRRKGKGHKKRVPLLVHPKIKAFGGWRTEPEPWTFKTVNKYVDWCHINKLFPYWRHKIHLAQNKANLGYCKSESFIGRCLNVWIRLYGEPMPYRNDNFCFFLVQMVYAECILKKKVDWTTLKELLVGDHPEEASIVVEDAPIDVKKMLLPVKPGKLALLDEEVVWSPNSSSDEHTHEYDGYYFQSDDEDVDMDDHKKALEVQLARKGKRKVEEPEIPSNVQEHLMQEKEEPMEVDNILVEGHQFGSDLDADDDADVLIAKIETACVALEKAREEIKEQQKIKDMKLSESSIAAVVHGLKEELKAVNNAIFENDESLVALRKSKDNYYKKKQENRVHLMDECAVLQQKLRLLEQERWRVQNERRLLNLQIDEEEKKNYVEALQCVSQLDILAKAPGYGSTEEEVSTLWKLVKLHEKKFLDLQKELEVVNSQCAFEGALRQWNLRTAAKGLKRVDLEKIGPKPKESDFYSTTL